MPVSIDLLYDGMVIPEDIYDAEASRLLIKCGGTLDANKIGSIKRHNSGRDIIYVTGNTYKCMLEKRPPIETESLHELEKATGYTEVKDETFDLLNEIAQTKSVKPEALHSVSNELSNRLESTSPSTILSLINALAPVDEYLQRHCVNVSLLNGLLGRWLGLPKEVIDRLVLIGLLHDCGKALVPAQVLSAPRKLSVAEFEVIKMHTINGYELLSDFPNPVRSASLFHHERFNGEGYPNRLSSDVIPLEARITAVSDIYDAMVSQRAYKEPQSPFSIMAMLNNLKDAELDARFVDTFNQNMPHELVGKPIMMSDGTVGIVHAFDPDDVEYPKVKLHDRVVKTTKDFHCISMYNGD
jgi:HD-GYP domain-containing protein (c-di-GMP phosphodiesterase class II)